MWSHLPRETGERLPQPSQLRGPLLDALLNLQALPPLDQVCASRIWRSSTTSSVVICEITDEATDGGPGTSRIVLAAAPDKIAVPAIEASPTSSTVTSTEIVSRNEQEAAVPPVVAGPSKTPPERPTGKSSGYKIPRLSAKKTATEPKASPPVPIKPLKRLVSPLKRQAPAKGQRPADRPPIKGLKCFNCERLGHPYSQCQQEVTEPFCMACGAKPYTIKTCPLHGTGWRARGQFHRYYGKNIPHEDYVAGNF